MKLPGLGASVLVIIAGIVIFYVPGILAQILYLNGAQSTVTCTDAFCIQLVIISFLGILTIILGIILTVVAYLSRPKHETGETNGSVAGSPVQLFRTMGRRLVSSSTISSDSVLGFLPVDVASLRRAACPSDHCDTVEIESFVLKLRD